MTLNELILRSGRRAFTEAYNRPFTSYQVVTETPDSVRWQTECVRCIQEGRPGDFLGWLDEHYPFWPATALGQLQVGAIHLYQGDTSAAEHHTRESLRLNQGDRDLRTTAFCNMARIAFGRISNGDGVDCADEAFAWLDRADQSKYLVHINRLCFASILEDRAHLEQAVTRALRDLKGTSSWERLLGTLRRDGDLVFLREQCSALFRRLVEGGERHA